LIIAKEGSHMGVNDTINTTMKGQTLTPSLVKPSPIKRMLINTSVNNINKHRASDAKATAAKVKVSDASITKTRITSDESVPKHGVIYGIGTSTDHEDMKILLIVSGVVAGLGFMYFYGH